MNDFIKDQQILDKDTFFRNLKKHFDKNQDWIDALNRYSDLHL